MEQNEPQTGVMLLGEMLGHMKNMTAEVKSMASEFTSAIGLLNGLINTQSALAAAPLGYTTPQQAPRQAPTPPMTSATDSPEQKFVRSLSLTSNSSSGSPFPVRPAVKDISGRGDDATVYNNVLKTLKNKYEWIEDVSMRQQSKVKVGSVVRGLVLAYPNMPIARHKFKVSQSFINEKKNGKVKQQKRDSPDDGEGAESIGKETTAVALANGEDIKVRPAPSTHQVNLYINACFFFSGAEKKKEETI